MKPMTHLVHRSCFLLLPRSRAPPTHSKKGNLMKRTTSKSPKERTQHPPVDPSRGDATPPKRSVEDVNNQLYQEAAQRILKAIEAGTSIWQKPWIAPSSHRRPFNAHTGLNYLGMNRVLLMTEMMANGWTDTRFMTYKQVQALAQDMKRSGTPDDELPYVKKGAQSITIYKGGQTRNQAASG